MSISNNSQNLDIYIDLWKTKTICKTSKEIWAKILNLYKIDNSFKSNIDNLLDSFNQNQEITIDIKDILKIQEEKNNLSIEKLISIKSFLEKCLDNFQIKIAINNWGNVLTIWWSIEEINISTIKIVWSIISIENSKRLLELAEAVWHYLSELKEKVDNILKTKQESKDINLENNDINIKILENSIRVLFDSLKQAWQKEVLEKIYANLETNPTFNKLLKTWKKSTIFKNLLTSYNENISLDKKEKQKLYMNLYFIFGDKDHTQRLQDKTIELLVNILTTNIELLKWIIDLKTWKLVYKKEKEKENENKEKEDENENKLIETDNKIEEEKTITSIDKLIEDLYNLDINKQKKFFISFCSRLIKLKKYDNITKNIKTKKIKSLASILKAFLWWKWYASFYTLFSDKGNKVWKKIISIFINNLLKDRELCYSMPNLSPLSIEKLEKIFEDLDNNKVKLDFNNQCPINTIVNKIDSLNINQQKDFFNSFCSILNRNSRYNDLTLDKNNLIREPWLIIRDFLWWKWYLAFSNLFKKSKKVSKRIIKILIFKTLKDEELAKKLYKNLNIDERTIELAKKKVWKNKDILFKWLDEKERRKRLLVKATIINRFPNLSIIEQRKFLLEIYCLISKDKSLLEKDKLNRKDFRKISSELNNFLWTKKTAIFSLFFLERNKIETKWLINKMALKFSENKEILDLCIKKFNLKNDIIKIENKFNNKDDKHIRQNAIWDITKPVIPREKMDVSKLITKLKQEKENNEKELINTKIKTEIEIFIKDLIGHIKSLKNRDISLSSDDFDLDNDYKLDNEFFDYLKDWVRKSKRWQRLLQIISEKELIEFLGNYLKIDKEDEEEPLPIINNNTWVQEKLSPDEIEQLEAQSISKKTSINSKISIEDFLPVLQKEINKRVLKKYPDSDLANYEVVLWHFTVIFNSRKNNYIYPDMFEDREKVFKNMVKRKNYWKRGKKKVIKKTRWQYIYDIMSKQELKQFLLEYTLNN